MEGRPTRMRRSKAVGHLLLLALVLGVASCGTQTALETQWRLPNLKGKPFNKLAVLAILKNKNNVKGFESAVVENFDKQGVQAVPGFTFLGDNNKLSKEEMEKSVAGTGADGVLIFKVIAVDKTHHYVPPTQYVLPDPLGPEWWDDDYWGYYNPYPWSYWGYWYPAAQVVTTPGYWKTATAIRVESSLYRVSDNKLVWTAVSDTYNPENEAALAKSLSSVVWSTLKKDGLIVK
jgi:hypothetical protein